MSELAIKAEGLSKIYRLGDRERYSALRDTLSRTLRAPWTLLWRPKPKTFWALKDVDIEVKQGEVLGLIGRNGAGKTTLLKILSRITRPSAGWAEIYGRVGSLLEVGTGFHPELSGRDNIFLSGAILGMAKREIARKFDEIVAFAEIEKFLDTQVKHYSSGMYVRLAFAVAAHLEPEILLVDEVLAVGDIKFQKKCLGKMGDVARAGRTVVLVSHQMNQIRRLCHRVAWVDDARLRQQGSPHEVVPAYESAMVGGDRGSKMDRRGITKARFLSWEIAHSKNGESHVLDGIDPVTVKFKVEVHEPIRSGLHGIALTNHEQQLIWAWATEENVQLEVGEHEFIYTFPMLPLRPGPYGWRVGLFDEGELLDMWECVPEMIVATKVYQHARDEWNGVLNIPSQFEISESR